MELKEAISLAISVMDVRADQWDAAADFHSGGFTRLTEITPELYEADEDECYSMSNDIRIAIRVLQENRHAK